MKPLAATDSIMYINLNTRAVPLFSIVKMMHIKGAFFFEEVKVCWGEFFNGRS